MIEQETQLEPSEETLFRQLGEEIVLLNLESEMYFGLNAMGAEMWNALTRTGTVAEAHRLLCPEFDVSPSELEQDLLAFAESLVERGLMTIAKPART